MNTLDERILGELKSLLTEERLGRIESVLEQRTDSLTIVLDRLHHPHNISAILRSADAFGVSDVHMLQHPANQGGSSGVSLGSEKWLQLHIHEDEAAMISSLREQGFLFVGMLPPSLESNRIKGEKGNPKSVLITDVPFEKKIALVFGSELHGLSESLKNELDLGAFIPMFGFAESFNVSVACAISLFCSHLLGAKVERRSESISEDRKIDLRADWIRQSVKNCEAVEKEIRNRLQAK